MKGIIRAGDKTTGGGTVLSGSTAMRFGVIGVTRKGYPLKCPIPIHGRTVIAEGRPAFKHNGVPIALDGNFCACGCALLSSLPEVGAS